MSLFRLSWSNLTFKKTLTFLTVFAVAIATALVVFIFLVNDGLQKNVGKGYGPFHVVVGAEGSASQLVLNTFYHIGAPTGNIDYEIYEELKESQFVEEVFAMTRGDNYKGYPIVGTPFEYLSTRYPHGSLQDGTYYKKAGEAVIGSYVAESLSLKKGDTFSGSHGVIDSGEEHQDFSFKVVGILSELGTPDDKAIFTTLDTAWIVHEGHGQEESEEDHTEVTGQKESHEEHGEEEDHTEVTGQKESHEEHGEEKDHTEVAGQEESSEEHDHENAHLEGDITAIVIKPKGLMDMQGIKSNFNDLDGVQVAYSGKTTSEILSIVDTGAKIIKLVALVTIFMAAISVLLSLSAMAADRKKDIGLLRLIGKSKSYIITGILVEANLLTVIGIVIGLVLGHLGSYLLTDVIFDYSGIQIQAWIFITAEIYIIVFGLIICTLAALVPALRSYRVDPIELFHS